MESRNSKPAAAIQVCAYWLGIVLAGLVRAAQFIRDNLLLDAILILLGFVFVWLRRGDEAVSSEVQSQVLLFLAPWGVMAMLAALWGVLSEPWRRDQMIRIEKVEIAKQLQAAMDRDAEAPDITVTWHNRVDQVRLEVTNEGGDAKFTATGVFELASHSQQLVGSNIKFPWCGPIQDHPTILRGDSLSISIATIQRGPSDFGWQGFQQGTTVEVLEAGASNSTWRVSHPHHLLSQHPWLIFRLTIRSQPLLKTPYSRSWILKIASDGNVSLHEVADNDRADCEADLRIIEEDRRMRAEARRKAGKEPES